VVNRNLLFSNFPELSSSRLILREVNLDDYDAIRELYQDSEIIKEFEFNESTTSDYRYIITQVLPELFNSGECVPWGLALKESNNLIGLQLSYIDGDNDPAVMENMLLENYRRQGYSLEAYIAIIKFLRNAGVISVKAKTKQSNLSSIGLLTKLGFKEIYLDFMYKMQNPGVLVFEKDLTQEITILFSDNVISKGLSFEDYFTNSIKKYNENEYGVALEYINKAIEVQPTNLKANYQKALINMSINGYVMSIPDFEKCIEIDSTFAPAYTRIGIALYNIYNRGGAYDYWIKAAELGDEKAKELIAKYSV